MIGQPGARVVVLGSYAPSLLNFRGPLIAALIAAGYDVHAAAPAIDARTADGLRALGATAHSVTLSNAGMNPLAAIGTTRALRQLFRSIEPAAVISYTIKPVTLGSVAARQAGVGRVIALVTGLGYAFTGGTGLKRTLARLAATILYRRAFKRCDAVIFQNPDDLADFRALGLLPASANTPLVNGSGVDLAHFTPAPLPPGLRFLMIARLLGDKGIREYVLAATRLKHRHPTVTFALAGYLDPSPDSLTEDELQSAIAQGIDYLGPLDDVRPAIADCSVYVLPSYREGTPRSVLEAMAMARPIITTDAPGCRQTVVDGVNGTLVVPRDADSLERVMEAFILDPTRIEPWGAASLKLVRERFDVVQVSRATISAAGLA